MEAREREARIDSSSLDLFVGRERELARLAEAYRADSSAFVPIDDLADLYAAAPA